ncbi:hypothetical protein [Arsukibacterium sp.]|uniref:hypothetical protein n=1 Tax=Arsukibacterium sp. TaxID=1977258 RepID=UPI002FDA37F0
MRIKGWVAVINLKFSPPQASGQSTASYAIRYTLRDRLGSVVSLTNEANALSEHRSYDPFGKPRRGDYRQWNPATLAGVVGATPFTSRGYTDHEHLDDAQLIHMTKMQEQFLNVAVLNGDDL